MDFNDPLKKIIRLLIALKKLTGIVQIEKKDWRIENFIKKYNYKNQISSVLNCFITPTFIPIYQLYNFLTTFFAQISKIDS